MSANDIKSLLPPITLSLGGMIPLLIGKSPFAVRSECKALFASVLVLVVWLGYWMAYMFGEWPFLQNAPIPTLIVIAAALMFTVLFAAQKPPIITKVSGKRNVQPKEIEKKRYFWMYVMALLCVSVAAAIYSAQSEEVIQDLDFPDGANELKGDWEIVSLARMEKVALGAHETVMIPMHLEKTGSGGKCILAKDEYARTEKFVLFSRQLTASLPASNAPSKVASGPPVYGAELPDPPLTASTDKWSLSSWIGKPNENRSLLQPGKGQHYQLTLHKQ